MFNKIHNRLAIVSVCGFMLIGGCASTDSSRPRSGNASGTASAPMSRPAPVRSSRVLAEIAPRGTVPYDMQSLPLVSPDGRYLATQTHVAPTWPSVLAQHDAQVPLATRIEIYSLDTDGVEFVAHVKSPAVLGRSYNDEGFLIEAPQQDGSRWIGLVSWSTGEVTWLVADDAVNAFACIGPDGRLAWNRREIDAPDDSFELVIRHHDHQWSMYLPYENWLMPTWSGRGDNLFALVLSEGALSMAFATATDETSLQQSRRGMHLASDATVYTAYQTIGAQISSPSLPATTETFVFHHPARARMAIWQPRGSNAASLTFLESNTFAAVMESEEHLLVTSDKHLMRQSLREPRDRREIIAGLQIPRCTSAASGRFILLSPLDGSIGITALNRLE